MPIMLPGIPRGIGVFGGGKLSAGTLCGRLVDLWESASAFVEEPKVAYINSSGSLPRGKGRAGIFIGGPGREKDDTEGSSRALLLSDEDSGLGDTPCSVAFSRDRELKEP